MGCANSTTSSSANKPVGDPQKTIFKSGAFTIKAAKQAPMPQESKDEVTGVAVASQEAILAILKDEGRTAANETGCESAPEYSPADVSPAKEREPVIGGIAENETDLPSPAWQEEEVVVLFQPGVLGIAADWSDGRVKEVVVGSQADSLGVQPGWKFVRVCGERYELALPGKYVALQQPFTVCFSTSSTQDATSPMISTTKKSTPIVESESRPIFGELDVVIEPAVKQSLCLCCGC